MLFIDIRQENGRGNPEGGVQTFRRAIRHRQQSEAG
jgi:hypothetical protein